MPGNVIFHIMCCKWMHWYYYKFN